MKRHDLTGRTFGRLRVIDYYGCVKSRAIWICRCECGNAAFVAGCDLKAGTTTSCSCGKKLPADKDAEIRARIARGETNRGIARAVGCNAGSVRTRRQAVA